MSRVVEILLAIAIGFLDSWPYFFFNFGSPGGAALLAGTFVRSAAAAVALEVVCRSEAIFRYCSSRERQQQMILYQK